MLFATLFFPYEKFSLAIKNPSPQHLGLACPKGVSAVFLSLGSQLQQWSGGVME
jgi:hypothetical protein